MRLHLRTDHDRGMVLLELLSDWIALIDTGVSDSIRVQAKSSHHRSISDSLKVVVHGSSFTRTVTHIAVSSLIPIPHMR